MSPGPSGFLGLPSPEQLCTNPVKYVCNPDLNPALIRALKAEFEFALAVQEMTENPEFKAIKKSFGVDQCLDLKKRDFKGYQKCIGVFNRLLLQKILTPTREGLAQQSFAHAKNAAIQNLAGHSSLLERLFRDTPELQTTVRLKEIQDYLQNTNLHIGKDLYNQDRDLEYNVSLSATPRNFETWGIFKDVAELVAGNEKTPLRNPTIILDGVLVNADTNPAGLEFIFLHEFAHAVFGHTSPPGWVFYRDQIECLQRADSAAAHPIDIPCYESMAKRNLAKHPEFAKQIGEIVASAKRHPYMYLTLPNSFPPEEKARCRESQADEAFADWFATETMVHTSFDEIDRKIAEGGVHRGTRDPQEAKRDLVLGAAAFFCVGYYQERVDSVSAEENATSHPLAETRIKQILFSNPRVLEAFGCSPGKFLSFPTRPTNPPERNKRAYCGNSLFAPVAEENYIKNPRFGTTLTK